MGTGSWRSSSGQLERRSIISVQFQALQFCIHALTSEMRLHALQRMHEHSPALEIHRSLLRHELTLNLTPGPEEVLHPAPRGLGVGSEIARAVLAHGEAGRGLRELDVDDAALVDAAADVVGLAVVGDLHGAVPAGEVLLVVGEVEVVQVVRGPELGAAGGVDDLRVELGGGAHAEDVAVDDLDEAELAFVAGHVEGLGLDVGGAHDFPAQVILGELGVGDILSLLGDGLNGLGAVFALGDADAEERRENVSVRVRCMGRRRGR